MADLKTEGRWTSLPSKPGEQTWEHSPQTLAGDAVVDPTAANAAVAVSAQLRHAEEQIATQQQYPGRYRPRDKRRRSFIKLITG